ncbi:MAG TPA: hypothetical protein VIW69_13505 [Candidatus Elarobacter sp.]
MTAVGEAGSLRPCDPWYAPWIPVSRANPDPRTAEERTTEERFIARARAAAAVAAPAAVAEPKACTTPNRQARTVYAARPDTPQYTGGGLSVILVLLDPSDKIANARVQRSAGNARLDAAALSAARASEFQGQIFRCRHVMGGYLFSVEFGPT